MENIVLVLLCLALGALLGIVLLRWSRGASSEAQLAAVAEQVKQLSQRVGGDTSLLAQRLEGIESRMSDSQMASAGLARDIFGKLGDVQRATATMAEQARQFTSLQDLLRAPKARGGLGEAMLEELLRQILPPSAYSCQHRFSNGLIVDAVVKAGGRKICIDSKFPLANYQAMCSADNEIERVAAERAFAADVYKHICDISSRYIVPDEDTLDFAVMYVPAEGLYGEVLRLTHRRKSVFELAIEARVVPMSPLTMYSYLQTVLFGFKCLRIGENAEQILDRCGRLQQDVERFAADYDVLGRHLTNAYTKYGDGARGLDRVRLDLDRVVDLAEEDPPSGPSLEVVTNQPPAI
jgi:DNA recombination protein RmuC